MLACVETLAPLEINLIACLADLLTQFSGYLGQVKPLGRNQKEVPYLMINAKTQESKMRTLGANKKSARALWFWHAEGLGDLLLWISIFYDNKIRS